MELALQSEPMYISGAFASGLKLSLIRRVLVIYGHVIDFSQSRRSFRNECGRSRLRFASWIQKKKIPEQPPRFPRSLTAISLPLESDCFFLLFFFLLLFYFFFFTDVHNSRRRRNSKTQAANSSEFIAHPHQSNKAKQNKK